MSEHEPNQEKIEPIYETCGNCETEYEHSSFNTRMFLFARQPECNYAVCRCPSCRTKSVYLIDESWRAQAQALGIFAKIEDYPSPTVYDMYLRARGIELPKEYELTHRHEQMIGGLATTMANCPDELLYDFITDDKDYKPYPTRWI